MDLKVKIYSAMPSFVKGWMTEGYMALRRYRETQAAKQPASAARPASAKPRVVYMTGFPRSGTTMLKYYFGSHPGLKQTPFNPVGFFHAWEMSEGCDEILIDKSNHYIDSLSKIFSAYGSAVRMCLIVRDPRDVIASITKYTENREVPRDERYWPYWRDMHLKLAKFARESEFAEGLFLVRYEDLVRFPVESKTAFLEWLGMDVAEGDVDNVYTNQNPGEGWDDSVHKRREVTDYSLQKWRQMEDPPDWARSLMGAWRKDAGAEEAMRLFGYDEGGFTVTALEGIKAAFFEPGES